MLKHCNCPDFEHRAIVRFSNSLDFRHFWLAYTVLYMKIVDCCKQYLKWIFRPSTHQSFLFAQIIITLFSLFFMIQLQMENVQLFPRFFKFALLLDRKYLSFPTIFNWKLYFLILIKSLPSLLWILSILISYHIFPSHL